jgi:hypothetical protein
MHVAERLDATICDEIEIMPLLVLVEHMYSKSDELELSQKGPMCTGYVRSLFPSHY